jgi:arabinose-5-phosphate isomerase
MDEAPTAQVLEKDKQKKTSKREANVLKPNRTPPKKDLKFNFQQAALRVLTIEREAIDNLANSLSDEFTKACECIMECKGRIIIIGMGKSGHIGRKIAATFASTGTPSFFVHPAEASHGDMGMITPDDVVIALSNSGNTEEIIAILPPIKRLNVPLISLCGKHDSTLSQAADINLSIAVAEEACPLGLAPTASTTVSLALGDALAIALLEARGFTAEDFAFSHPGGSLGRRLLLRVSDLMHAGADLPVVTEHVSIQEALVIMTQKGLGMTTVVDATGKLVGIYTDGDLRRSLNKKIVVSNTPISQEMSRSAKTIAPEALAAEALQVMEANKINGLIAVDEALKPIGALNMQDLIRAKVV